MNTPQANEPSYTVVLCNETEDITESFEIKRSVLVHLPAVKNMLEGTIQEDDDFQVRIPCHPDAMPLVKAYLTDGFRPNERVSIEINGEASQEYEFYERIRNFSPEKQALYLPFHGDASPRDIWIRFGYLNTVAEFLDDNVAFYESLIVLDELVLSTRTVEEISELTGVPCKGTPEFTARGCKRAAAQQATMNNFQGDKRHKQAMIKRD